MNLPFDFLVLLNSCFFPNHEDAIRQFFQLFLFKYWGQVDGISIFKTVITSIYPCIHPGKELMLCSCLFNINISLAAVPWVWTHSKGIVAHSKLTQQLWATKRAQLNVIGLYYGFRKIWMPVFQLARKKVAFFGWFSMKVGLCVSLHSRLRSGPFYWRLEASWEKNYLEVAENSIYGLLLGFKMD